MSSFISQNVRTIYAFLLVSCAVHDHKSLETLYLAFVLGHLLYECLLPLFSLALLQSINVVFGAHLAGRASAALFLLRVLGGRYHHISGFFPQ
jgi:hypothetical protein